MALNWVANRPAVSSTIIGATKIKQLEDNFSALEFTIPAEQLLRLDDISATEVPYPYYIFSRKEFRDMVSGGTNVSPTAVQRAS